MTFYAWTMLVESVRLRLALIAPLRLALSAVWLVAARADGAPSGATLIALAAGAFASAFLVTNDPFARFRKAPDKVAELPVGSSVAPAWLHVVHAALVELRLGRLGLDRQHAQVAHLALRLEIRRAGERAQRRNEREAHQNFPFTPSVGRMGRPETLPWSRKR